MTLALSVSPNGDGSWTAWLVGFVTLGVSGESRADAIDQVYHAAQRRLAADPGATTQDRVAVFRACRFARALVQTNPLAGEAQQR